jgi:hypothetical protein
MSTLVLVADRLRDTADPPDDDEFVDPLDDTPELDEVDDAPLDELVLEEPLAEPEELLL